MNFPMVDKCIETEQSSMDTRQLWKSKTKDALNVNYTENKLILKQELQNLQFRKSCTSLIMTAL